MLQEKAVKYRIIALMPLFALVVSGCGEKPATATATATVPEAGKLTARAMLEPAIAEARKWEPDAELVGVTTSLADGPAHDFWFYDFQSPARSTCTRASHWGALPPPPSIVSLPPKPISASGLTPPVMVSAAPNSANSNCAG